LRKWAGKCSSTPLPCGPDLALSDFHSVGLLKEALGVWMSWSGPAACSSYLADSFEKLYTARFIKLVQQWKEFVELKCFYVEMQVL